MDISKYYENSILSEASYAELQNKFSPEYVTKALTDKDFTLEQATDFTSHWRVADHIPNEPTGFSDTVFESLDTPGKSTLPIRLTVFFTQLITDLILSCLAETCLQFAPLVYINLWNESEQSYNLF